MNEAAEAAADIVVEYKEEAEDILEDIEALRETISELYEQVMEHSGDALNLQSSLLLTRNQV